MGGVITGGQGEILVSRSRFCSFVFPIKTLTEVKDTLNRIKRQYPDAKHIPYAYVFDATTFADDDGEPSGTAGYPLLNLLRQANAERTLLLVVRYFGGQLLGSKRLLQAFKEAGKIAVTGTVWGRIETSTSVTLSGPLEQMGQLSRFVEETNAHIDNIHYNNKINVTLVFTRVDDEALAKLLGEGWLVVAKSAITRVV